MQNPFEDLMIVVDSKPIPLNVIGLIKMQEDEAIVVSDVPQLSISDEEYEIFLLDRANGQLSVQSIDNDELYNKLCELWEEKVQEEAENDS